jgi:hypothetical protein
VVDQLANEYSGQPVVFIEHDIRIERWSREGRWWAAFGGSTAYFPMVMVDSGHQITMGYEDFHTVYKGMVDAALARPAQGEMQAHWARVGNRIRFEVQLTNGTPVTLSASNGATVHAIVYEDTTVNATSRLSRAAAYVDIANLEPGATASYVLETEDLQGVDWSKLHMVALADYRPGGTSGPYDVLQAAMASPLTLPEQHVYLPCVTR